MAIYAGVGLSKQQDSYQAGYEACKQAIEKSGKGKPDITFVFSSVSFEQAEVIKGVREASNNAS